MSENQNSSCERGMGKYFFRASAVDFKKISGSPIVYWVGERSRYVFSISKPLDSLSEIKQGLATCNNGLFLRLWFEVDLSNSGYGMKSQEDAFESGKKWFPYNKGGGYRKWYGNNEYLVNWKNNGEDIHGYSSLPLDYSGAPVRAKRFYFREGITYGLISSFGFSARRVFGGFVFDVGGSMIFPSIDITKLQAFLCSKLTSAFVSMLNPTLNYQVGDIQKLPIFEQAFSKVSFKWERIIEFAKVDWDMQETSWDFTSLPLLHADYCQQTLKASYQKLRTHWREITLEMQRLEQENNRIFIDAYGLQDELTPEVPLNEITLTCNPHYRYGGDKTEVELEAMLLADTMRELVSYAVGCMMGRYSLDEPGLIYADAGNIGFDPQRYTRFSADADGIVPVSDLLWFTDDATIRLKEFLATAWGQDTQAENLLWLADSLGRKGDETAEDALRRYIAGSFFKDHLQTYKKRPIYWLFSSGKQKAFEALIYLHRYNEGTLARMRAEYVVPLTGKMAERIKLLEDDALKASSPASRKKIDKDIEKLKKKLDELRTYDEKLRHYADMRISLDLDDGVKVNYGKFGDLLAEVKAVTGGKDDE